MCFTRFAFLWIFFFHLAFVSWNNYSKNHHFSPAHTIFFYGTGNETVQSCHSFWCQTHTIRVLMYTYVSIIISTHFTSTHLTSLYQVIKRHSNTIQRPLFSVRWMSNIRPLTARQERHYLREAAMKHSLHPSLLIVPLSASSAWAFIWHQ